MGRKLASAIAWTLITAAAVTAQLVATTWWGFVAITAAGTLCLIKWADVAALNRMTRNRPDIITKYPSFRQVAPAPRCSQSDAAGWACKEPLNHSGDHIYRRIR